MSRIGAVRRLAEQSANRISARNVRDPTREGKVVVVQHRAISDPETGGRYTIKRYESKKVVTEDGNWRHQLITLHPDSDRPLFKPLVIEVKEKDSDDEFSVVAEMLMVLEAS